MAYNNCCCVIAVIRPVGEENNHTPILSPVLREQRLDSKE